VAWLRLHDVRVVVLVLVLALAGRIAVTAADSQWGLTVLPVSSTREAQECERCAVAKVKQNSTNNHGAALIDVTYLPTLVVAMHRV
jgi:hypothetical protein